MKSHASRTILVTCRLIGESNTCRKLASDWLRDILAEWGLGSVWRCTKHRRLRRTYDSDATDWKRKHKSMIYKQKSCNTGEYSRLSLDGHLYTTDNSVKRTLKSWSLPKLLSLTLYKTDITLKRTFSTGLKSSPLKRDDCNSQGLFHGGGGPQIAEVTCGGSPHLSCKRDQLIMRDYMDRRVTLPKQATSPT